MPDQSPFYSALRLLNRRAIRRRPMRERAQVMNAILAAVDAAIMDAHMSGRVYAQGGEKRNPGDEHRVMLEHAHAAGRREYERQLAEF